MSIEVVLEGQLEEEKDFEGYIRLLQELCEKWKLKIEPFEKFALIEVCPEGFIEVTYEDTFLSISAQTNVAGPGFHAYVCDFFEAIQKESPLELQVSDPTNYFEQKNFEKLKHDIFYRWLQDIATYVKEYDREISELCISWPMDYYQPQPKEGHVVTPMGYISVHDFMYQDIETLAERFFIWNNQGRDAQYYRSAALNIMWKECYFEYTNMNEYTEKQADIMLDLLEIAYDLDPELPLPMNEYEYLCKLRGRSMKITDAKRMVTLQDIGYRRNLVEFHFGNWSIPAHGCAEKSIDESNQTLYLMAPYEHSEEPWKWMYKINIYAFKQEIEEFLPEIAEHEQSFTFEHENIKAMGNLEYKEDHILLNCQCNCGKEMMLIQVIICNEADVDALMKQIKMIKCRKVKDDAIKA